METGIPNSSDDGPEGAHIALADENSQVSQQEPRVADAPFDDQKADLVLRSSDGVDFHVYRIILSLASPTFQSMFADQVFDPTPIVKMPENAQTLDYILRCCYPIWISGLTQLKDIRPVLYAAHKYNIDMIMKTLKISLEHCADEDCLGVFAIAHHCGLYDVCDTAAKRFVRHPFMSQYSPHLDQISARPYHEILQYHFRCSTNPSSSVPAWAPANISPSPRKAALSPFDNKPLGNADVILRSSDGVEFYVHKAILSLSSPMFRDMLSLPQQSPMPVTVTGADVPVVDVTEDADTLQTMLQCCYPTHWPTFDSLRTTRLVLAAAQKYEINIATSHAKKALCTFLEDNQDVLGIFCIAIQFELYEICNKAAKLSITSHQLSLDSTELDHIPAHFYHHLALYHYHCCKAASAVASSRSWFSKDISSSISTKYCCSICQTIDPDGGSNWYAPTELWEYLRRAGQALRLRPHHSTVFSENTRGQWHYTIFKCKHCKNTLPRGYFSQIFATEVERAVNAVDIPIFSRIR